MKCQIEKCKNSSAGWFRTLRVCTIHYLELRKRADWDFKVRTGKIKGRKRGGNYEKN